MGTPEHWQRVKELFHAALEHGPAERASFLDEACASDDELRREVESLIASHERPGSFIDSPAYEGAAEMLTGERFASLAGQTLGHYKVLSLLGAGGMGEVYHARDARLGREVAIKVLPPALSLDRERLLRFEREARTASALNHPNVCTIHEIGESEDGRHYIVMEYVEGRTLRDLLKEKGMKVAEALEVGVQVASALAAAHAAGVI